MAAKRRESTFVRLRAHEFPVPISVEFLLRSAGLGPDERLGDEEEEAILALLEEYSHMSREFMTEESEVQDQIIKEKLARGEYYDEETFTPLYQHDAWFATPRCFAGPKLDGKYVYVVLFEEDVDPRLLELEERRAQAIEDILAQIHALIRKR